MSEYWKSTPKYWCKYCSTYVKDTPLEKTNHESSPRHQGNLKKSLRDLHRTKEKAERDAQYAKAEAARLNGAGSAEAPLAGDGSGKFKTTVNFTRTASKAATQDDRKRQMAELAALGVAVPEDFRRENAMVGDWQTTAQKITWDQNLVGKEEVSEEVKPGLNIGVRKRKTEEKPEEEEEEEEVKLEEGKKRPRYGRDLKTLPGDEDDDLDALLGSTITFKKKTKTEEKDEIKTAGDTGTAAEQADQPETNGKSAMAVKEEIPEDVPLDSIKPDDATAEDGDLGSIFKKRKKPTKMK